MLRRLLFFLLAIIGWAIGGKTLVAQRVQFPSAAPSYGTPTPVIPPTPAPSLPGFDPYGNPLLGTPPPDVPYNFAPNITPPANPLVVPQIAPPATPGVPQQGGSLFPSGLPYQWESGAYQYPNSDGTVARLQRFLQEISFEHTWIWGDESAEKLGINRAELAATFAVPVFYNPDTPLLITPGFAFNWLDGPSVTADLPPRVYDAYLDGAWHPRLTDWLHADLGLRTGVWTDFEEVNSDSIRILGRGLGVLAISPQFDVLIGVWYLDRNRIKMLPAGGLHWRPSSEWDAYLVFPNPKIRKRSVNIGSSQWWVYAAGEYGGGRWTIRRDPAGVAGDVGDDFDYNDIRVIFGFEWETQTQARGHFEVGYVFDRELLYDKTKAPAKLKLDDSIMLRAGGLFLNSLTQNHFFSRVFLLSVLALSAATTRAAINMPSQPWGGQAISDGIPYQPSLLLADPKSLIDQGKQFSVPLDSSVRIAALTSDAVLNPGEAVKATEPQLPPGARDGIFQKLFFTGTWLPQLEGDSLGWGDLETGIVFGFPFFRRDTPLLITPRFGVHFLERPPGADLPDRVYDSSFEFRHLRKFGDSPWAMDVAVTLGYYSDFESSDGDAFRVTGRGLAVYETISGTKWVFGVGYFNRAGVSVLPIGGVIHQPTPDVKWEFIFPRPRIAWRLPGGIPGSGDERWFYVGGEFGSGIWSIARPSTGMHDNITYSDYRILVGYERNITGGLSRRFELGYVFGREFEFDSATPDLELDDTLFVRAGFTF